MEVAVVSQRVVGVGVGEAAAAAAPSFGQLGGP